MKVLLTLFIAWLLSSGSVLAQHTIFFTSGHSGRASVVKFKEKTVLIKSFDNPRAPLQEISKNTIERIVMADGKVLTATEIATRQSPSDEVSLFVNQEASRFNADDGSPRPVAYGWSNFLGQSITLVSVRHNEKNTILTFIRRRNSWTGTQIILSSATYLYNRQDVREAFRIVNAGKFDLDVPITIPASLDSLQYELYFERVKPGLEDVNFKSLPIAAGSLGGPVGGYLITGLSITNPLTAGITSESTTPAVFFGATPLSCITCGGVGNVRCPNCSGSGFVSTTQYLPNGQHYRVVSQRSTCSVCQGKGSIICPNRPNHPGLP